jgi:Rad3-related DNA helicase
MPGSIDYNQLFQELSPAAFSALRPAQREALDRYSKAHSDTPDLAIELPTGAGKSLIALLICEAWRREGSTVAVLTGNKTLARQMEEEGRRLGVPVVRFEGAGGAIPLTDRRRYRRAQAIAIMNYWVMFNQNPVVDSADLMVVDDAHLAEAALDSLFSIEIDRYAHPVLFDSLVHDLAQTFPDYATFQDAVTDVPSRAGTELLNHPGKGGGSRTRRMEPCQTTHQDPSGGTRPSFASGQSGCTSKQLIVPVSGTVLSVGWPSSWA